MATSLFGSSLSILNVVEGFNLKPPVVGVGPLHGGFIGGDRGPEYHRDVIEATCGMSQSVSLLSEASPICWMGLIGQWRFWSLETDGPLAYSP